uniref:Germin-like protein n=1 Tax=Kalanchoe fedtschenkoi TaxID=63787 RepID=A0A7N1A0C6_KALFE
MAEASFFIIFSLAIVGMLSSAKAGDPDITSDFILPSTATVSSSYFLYTGLRAVFNSSAPRATLKASKASMAEFPALAGQSVSMAVLQFPPGAVNPPHVNSRASGILFVVRGSLEVGLVDTSNKLYTQTLHLGDVFVFPKGLVHFQYNADARNPATGVAAFGSASSGTFSIPTSVFEAGISDGILAESFKTDAATIRKLRAGLYV